MRALLLTLVEVPEDALARPRSGPHVDGRLGDAVASSDDHEDASQFRHVVVALGPELNARRAERNGDGPERHRLTGQADLHRAVKPDRVAVHGAAHAPVPRSARRASGRAPSRTVPAGAGDAMRSPLRSRDSGGGSWKVRPGSAARATTSGAR